MKKATLLFFSIIILAVIVKLSLPKQKYRHVRSYSGILRAMDDNIDSVIIDDPWSFDTLNYRDTISTKNLNRDEIYGKAMDEEWQGKYHWYPKPW